MGQERLVQGGFELLQLPELKQGIEYSLKLCEVCHKLLGFIESPMDGHGHCNNDQCNNYSLAIVEYDPNFTHQQRIELRNYAIEQQNLNASINSNLRTHLQTLQNQ